MLPKNSFSFVFRGSSRKPGVPLQSQQPTNGNSLIGGSSSLGHSRTNMKLHSQSQQLQVFSKDFHPSFGITFGGFFQGLWKNSLWVHFKCILLHSSITVVEPYQLLCYWSNFSKLLLADWFKVWLQDYDFHSAKRPMIKNFEQEKIEW